METSPKSRICTLPDCTNPITPNPKAKRPTLYCSPACRQKAYRRRQAPPKRNAEFVTIWDQAVDAIEKMGEAQRQKLQAELERRSGRLQSVKPLAQSEALTVDELQAQGDYIVYYCNPRGSVVHFNQQNQSTTYCQRKTVKMKVSHALPRDAKVCQQCQKRYKEIRS